MTEIRRMNWPTFWSGFAEGVVEATVLIGFVMWLAVLPTVGLLYFLGALA